MLILFSFFGLFGQKNSTPALESGQIWTYENRKNEDQSRVIILRIEDYGLRGKVVHIALTGLKINNSNIAGGISDEIGHLPFDEESLTKSLKKLVKSKSTLPDFEDGYNQWKQAFDNETGGVFTCDIKEAVDFVDKSMNQ